MKNLFFVFLFTAFSLSAQEMAEVTEVAEVAEIAEVAEVTEVAEVCLNDASWQIMIKAGYECVAVLDEAGGEIVDTLLCSLEDADDILMTGEACLVVE